MRAPPPPMRLARLVSTSGRRLRRAPPPAAWRADGVVLGIESSCDDTGVALVTGDGRVLGSALATQVSGVQSRSASEGVAGGA